MSNETKTARGGFRASLALLVSIIAIIVAIVAFNRSGGQADFKAKISDLQSKIKTLSAETSEKVNTVRKETARVLQKIGIEINKESVEKPEGDKEQIKKQESSE